MMTGRDSRLLAEQRRRKILELIEQKGQITAAICPCSWRLLQSQNVYSSVPGETSAGPPAVTGASTSALICR